MFKVKGEMFDRNVDFYNKSGINQPTHDRHKNNDRHDFNILTITSWLDACDYELFIRKKA